MAPDDLVAGALSGFPRRLTASSQAAGPRRLTTSSQATGCPIPASKWPG